MMATARCSSCAFSAHAAVAHEAACGGDALERAVHQHDDQAVRIRGRDTRMRRGAAVGGEF